MVRLSSLNRSAAGVLLLFLLLIGCDSSENDSLLNPPLPDSAEVRILNLIASSPVTATLGGSELAASVPYRGISSRRTFYFNQLVPLVLSSSVSTDTLVNQRIISGLEERVLTTYVVTQSGDSTKAVQLVVGEDEVKLLESSEEGRFYFFNGTTDLSIGMNEGCSNGPALFGSIAPGLLAGSRDFGAGARSLYLIDPESGTLLSTVRLDLQPGEVIALIALPGSGGTIEIASLDLTPGSSEPANLEATDPETRTTTSLRVVNGMDGGSFDVELAESDEPVVTGLASRQVSDAVEITPCGSAAGDSLRVIEATGDTVLIPFTGTIGTLQTLLLYKIGGEISSISLEEGVGQVGDSVHIKGLNLISSDTTYSIVVGAGAPGDLSRGSLLLPRIAGGKISAEKMIAPGLYPLALEFSRSGEFQSGGLHSFSPGSYVLIATLVNGLPKLLILDASASSTGLVELDAPGTRSIFFSAKMDDPVTIDITTSLGRLSIPSVAFTYVFPTVLPLEQIALEASGTQSNVDVGPDGIVVGWIGEAASGEFYSTPRNGGPAPSGKANLRFLNAAPGSTTLHVRVDGTEGEAIATIPYRMISDQRSSDARRYSFVVTPEGQNDELARITGVQLSELRNYLLVITPAEQDNKAPVDYGILLIQE